MPANKHTLLRNTLRSTLRSKERFISLFGIIAISTGFFAGLKVTSTDMKDSAEQYYRDTALMDLHLVSNVGFCEEEIALLSARSEIRQLYSGYSEIAYLPLAESIVEFLLVHPLRQPVRFLRQREPHQSTVLVRNEFKVLDISRRRCHWPKYIIDISVQLVDHMRLLLWELPE